MSWYFFVNFVNTVLDKNLENMAAQAYSRCELLSFSKLPGWINAQDWRRLCQLKLITYVHQVSAHPM